MLSAENPLRGENRRESEYLTKHKDLQLPAYFKPEAKSISLDFLKRNPKERLGCRERGVEEIKSHPFFTKVNDDGDDDDGGDGDDVMRPPHTHQPITPTYTYTTPRRTTSSTGRS